MYLCNTKRPWQTKIICAFTNIVKMQNQGNLQTDNHQNWCYFQKQQKADPPLECRGRCSSSSCTACLENNSRSYMINSASPSVNINNSEVQSGNTPHFFIWAVWRNSSSSTPIPTPRVALQNRNSLLYRKKKLTLHWKKKKNPKAAKEDETQKSVNFPSLFHNYNGKVSLLGLNEEVQAFSVMNSLATPHLWSI